MGSGASVYEHTLDNETASLSDESSNISEVDNESSADNESMNTAFLEDDVSDVTLFI